MPIYEYQCENCHKLTETLLRAGEKGPRKCAHCGGKLSRVISRTSFQLKGGGWYKDLYASAKPDAPAEMSGDGAAASSNAPESKGESKSESKGGAKGEAKAETKSEAKAEAKPAAKTPSDKPAKAASSKASTKAAPAKKTG
jgi:putative FmdB family regulatory protein